ncbi:ANTAR domain-containing protein [Streptomyces sp. NPDC046887]|uniref:ANTAR domain-containing protein n=1 Tax=Streptomyces sp. NPDC046887 TaxID=3155472 RepID=UPI0033CDD5E6
MSGEIAALREEIAQLRYAAVSHAVIDQAIGVVPAYGGLRSDTGWEVLREVSQHTNTKLREVAEYLVQWPHRAWLPPEIQHGLDAALERRGRPPDSGRPPSGPAGPAVPGTYTPVSGT